MSTSKVQAVHRIAVVGSGPRGLIVVERLAARLAEDGSGRPVEIHLIDAVEVGAGRVYRTDQPDWFLMNTVAGMVSAFSGVPDDGPTRAGAGPSLYEWWRTVDPENATPDGYAARADYGRYTQFLLSAVEANLPATVSLVRTLSRVDDLRRTPDGYRLTFSTGTELVVDQVVLTTGHSAPTLTGTEKALADFAATRPHLRYIRGDSAADMPLRDIPAGTPVGVIGLGLSFYDVLAELTLGRGGRFTERADGSLEYLPSGAEPVIVAGSRSGMPLPARGRNQKPPRYSYKAVLFTQDNIRGSRPVGPLDFRADVLPWLLAEMDLVRCATMLRQRSGEDSAAAFTGAVVRAAATGAPPDVVAIAGRVGITGVAPLDLDALARPFEGRRFADRAEFDRALVATMRADLREADLGNVDSPFKAAMDVIRDCRGFIMKLADFSGLAPTSHRDDFIGWYAPRSAFLAAGPPPVRLRQVIALLDCGLLRVIGPHARFAGDPELGRFTLSSPRVTGARTPVDVIVDARIPDPDLDRDLSPLTQRLRDSGIWSNYVNGEGPEAFRTGGVAVTTSPYHPVGRDGTVDTGLYVVGIPTEHTRWFMQVGSNRPGLWGDFVYDADAIAAHVIKEGS
ncbi:FAD/NAD(P)-binding protein [Actinokineospora sp.]|uniref:FAD/NAD(P)-binding protein n=1 Tax=Actinokineospora sp. TaxID=1872133 RepID=UPI004037CF8A